ncbi:MAG: sigma-70 family RNA polymerase sigma factor [Bacteroidetes bacterium]|nr:sigma-70 family RNA polymerase sigma factor [Bacteroidota bacterium]
MGFQIYSSNETELIDGCLRQNHRAQQQLYQRYAGKMYAVCCRYVKDRAQAEDILVMAFTKLFDRISQYKGEGSFEGWVRRIMVNESLSYLRKYKNMYLETDIEAAAFEPDYQKLENELEASDLLKLIESLPVGYRTVFNLYAIDGYSHLEIAAQLGISENTSKSQLSRARTYLQKKLTEWDYETIQKTN